MRCLFVLVIVLLSGCQTIPTLKERSHTAEQLILSAQMYKLRVKSGNFQFFGSYRFSGNSKSLRVYIEGDGLAWITRRQLSQNPTPVNPVALKLASSDNHQNIVWLARPCQYQVTGSCDSRYWSHHRFAADVIDDYQSLLDQLKKQSGATSLELVGFSGGAAIAVLVAAVRDDVRMIMTVAGNLDHQQLHQIHRVSQLNGSLNPADIIPKVQHIPQVHFAGSEDRVIPAEISRTFTDRINQLSNTNNAKVITVQNAGHTHGWVEQWPLLLKKLETKIH